MKRIFTLAIALLCSVMIFGQIPRQDRAFLTKSVKTEHKKPLRDLPQFTQGINPAVSAVRQSVPEETLVGITWYDLFTNSHTGNNLFVFEDGTMAAAWTYGIEASSFPDRGTGYNYFDLENWGSLPASRLESLKTGWGHVSDWGADGEITIAHNADNLQICRRATKGTGEWEELNYTGVAFPSWPRQVCSGENNEYLHVIYHSYDAYGGMPGAMLYSRSMDGGDTWDPEDLILDGTGPEFYYEIMGETYSLAARGNTVAILVGGAWNDMFLMKSEDNGDSWEKIMIWEHPYPFFDFETTVTDTTFCPDNSASIAIDTDGKCHVVFGISRTLHAEAGSTFDVFPYIDGIGYWNEDMPAFSDDLNALAPPQYGYAGSEMIEDYNYIGWTQDVDGDGEISLLQTSTGLPMSYDSYGLSTMPSIHIDDEGWIFVVFASTTETYDNFEWNYKKLWERKRIEGNWSMFEHLTQNISHIFDESIYPCIADRSDDQFYYLLYQADASPGLALNGDHDYQENRIIVAQVEKSPVGIGEPSENTGNALGNYPNPFSENTTIKFTLSKDAIACLSVVNTYGQEVRRMNCGFLQAGTHYVKIEREGLPSGMYVITLSTGKESVSSRMIVL